MIKNIAVNSGITPFIRNKERPVTICWQFKITGLKLES